MYKLMIVEDEAIIRKGLVQNIDWQNLGFRVTKEASNGKAALKQLEEDQPDVILTDVRMPIMDGLALMTEVNQRYPQIKLIVLSGYGDFQYAQHALKCGAVDYILKPTKDADITTAFSQMKQMLDRLMAPVGASESTSGSTPESVPDVDQKAALFEKDPLIDCVKAYIDANYQEKITLESAARIVHMNSSYLCTYFKKSTGESFKDYLTRVRMQKAREMIQNTDLKVYIIAAQVGYDDYRYFAKIFKSVIGLSIAQIRKGC